ncbi:MAG: AhpC/TSA family protein [Chitinophagaceae bacterium]|nr:AhpC/TSA family protein [Chitinophagaceae bacterium]
MKRLLFLLLSFPLLVNAQTSTKGYTIEGKIDGYPDGTIVHLYKNGENVESGSAKLLKSKFALKGKVDEPMLCFLIIGEDKPIEIYVENAIITIKGKKSQSAPFEISGSSSHKDFAEFLKGFMPLSQQSSSLAATINKTVPGAERDALMITYNNLQAGIQNEIDKFIKAKPRSYVSAFLLRATYQFKEDITLLENRYKLLDASVKNSAAGKDLAAFIAESKIGAVGTEAIDFSQADTMGNPVSLSSFRGKYVLVDFWASWCGPCRSENPNVVENFKKFSSKNFTVLGVSLDRPGQKAKWLEAIKEDKLTWTHVSDLQFWNNAAAVLYNIKGIPQNILVDPQGMIVGKNLRGPALEEKLCELLGCETKGF